MVGNQDNGNSLFVGLSIRPLANNYKGSIPDLALGFLFGNHWHNLPYTSCVLLYLSLKCPTHGFSILSWFLQVPQVNHAYVRDLNLGSIYEREHVAIFFLGQSYLI